MAISWLLYTNLQKTKHCVGFFARTFKTKHTTDTTLTPFQTRVENFLRYLISVGEGGCKKNVLGGKKSKNELAGSVGPSIRHSRVGTKFGLKMTRLNIWIKLTQKGYF